MAEECNRLKVKLSAIKQTLVANITAFCGMIEDISEEATPVSEISGEIHAAENHITMRDTKKEQLEQEVSKLAEQLENTKEEGSVLKEKIEKLEAEVNREKGEKEELQNTVSQLGIIVEDMKDKNNWLSHVGKATREATRHFGSWIDFQQHCYDKLTEILSERKRGGRC
ncbi:hypothetical protein Ancab_015406 [Ancistrocladus abbreviatus]